MTDSTRPKHPAQASRIAAAGIGIATVLGLASGLEIAKRDQPTVTTSASNAAKAIATGRPASGSPARQTAAVSSPRPIVLTPRAVVHVVKVAAPAASGGSTGSGYVASSGSSSWSGQSSVSVSAPAPAAAPVASTSGSH